MINNNLPAIINRHDFQYKHYFITQDKKKDDKYYLYLWAYEPVFMEVNDKGYIQAYQKYGNVIGRHRYSCTIGQEKWTSDNNTNALLYSDLVDTLVYNNFTMNFGNIQFEKKRMPDDQVIPAVEPEFPEIPCRGDFQYKHYIVVQNKGKLESYDLYLWAYEPAYMEVSDKGYIEAFHKFGSKINRHRYSYTIGQKEWSTNNITNSLLYNDFADALVYNNFELNVSSDYYARNDQPNDQVVPALDPEFPQLPVISGAENSFKYYLMSQDLVVLEKYTLYLLKEKPCNCQVSEKDIVYFLDAEGKQIEIRQCSYTVGSLKWTDSKKISGINSAYIRHFIDFCNFEIKADDLSSDSDGYVIEAPSHFYSSDGIGIGSIRNGWTKVNGKSYYYEDGTKFFGWLQEERSRSSELLLRYLNEKTGGAMAADGPKYVKKSHNYFDENGIMATSDRTIDNKTFVISSTGDINGQNPECESYIARTTQKVEVFDDVKKEYPLKVATFEQGDIIKAVVPNVSYTRTTNMGTIHTVYVKVYYDGQKNGWIRRSLLLEHSWVAEGSIKIADKYYAKERLKIRDAANGNQIDGNKAFIAGAIVRVHESKEIFKVEGSDEEWLKVYYDSSKIGWVAISLLEELPKPITGHKFQYDWDKSQYVSQKFKDKATGVAKSLGIDPDDLMAVIAFESYFNPAQKNMDGGSATGLVQFMPDTAQDLHTTTTELAAMTGVEQLDYVYGYFYPYKGKLVTLSDIYMRVLWPKGIGMGEEEAIFTKGDGRYEANEGLDINLDNKITKKEATQKVIDEKSEYYFG